MALDIWQKRKKALAINLIIFTVTNPKYKYYVDTEFLQI